MPYDLHFPTFCSPIFLFNITHTIMLKSLNILIASTNVDLSHALKNLITSFGYDLKGSVNNTAAALVLTQKQQPDVVLLDLSCKGKFPAIAVAKKIQQWGIPIVLTGNSLERQKYKNSIKYSFPFFSQPIEREALKKAITTALQSNSSARKAGNAFCNSSELYLKNRNTYQRVDIPTINFVQAQGDYIFIHTEKERIMSSLNLSDLEQLLKSHSFVKVHRSFMVNLKKVSTIDFKNNKINISGQAIPLSRRMKTQLKNKITSRYTIKGRLQQQKSTFRPTI